MRYVVSTVDLANLTLNETDTVRSVLQNVAVILATRRGECPMFRDFGVDQDFVDKPLTVARAMLYAQVKEAVEMYEPRAQVTEVRISGDALTPGSLTATVEVDIIGT